MQHQQQPHYTQQSTTSNTAAVWNGGQWVTNNLANTTPNSNVTNLATSQQLGTSSTSNEDYWSKQLGISNLQRGSAAYEEARKKAWDEYYRRQAATAAQSSNQTAQTGTNNTKNHSNVYNQQQHVLEKQYQPVNMTNSNNNIKSRNNRNDNNNYGTNSNNASIAGGTSQYPESLKRYVQRSLASVTTEQEKQQINSNIEKQISDAILKGTLWSIDWDTLHAVDTRANCSNAPAYSVEGINLINDNTKSERKRKKRWDGGEQQQPQPQQQRSVSNSFNIRDDNDNNSYTYRNGGNQFHHFSTTMSFNDQNKFGHYGSSNGAPSSVAESMTSIASSSKADHGYYGPSSSYMVSNDSLESKHSNKKSKKVSPKSKKMKSQSTNKKGTGFEASNKTLAARANRFSEHYENTGKKKQVGSPDKYKLQEQYMGAAAIGGSSAELGEEDFERMTVKGTCMVLEKDYFRLTSPPQPEQVRPPSILQKHLANLKEKWRSDSKCSYEYMCSQLKAMRQDLTVQRINDKLSVDVYETHARIALEQNDLNEFNQCQTQLRYLYEDVMRCASVSQEDRIVGLKNENEFLSYRLLYYIFLTTNKKYDGGSSDMTNIILTFSSEQRKDPMICHALKVRVAVSEFNYHSFFRLFKTSPRMGPFLMDHISPFMRQAALHRMCKSYGPLSLDVSFVLRELNFNEEREEGLAYLESCGCKLKKEEVNGSKQISWLIKETRLRESTLKKANSLI